MAVPHPGARWSDPQIQQQRRAEAEKQQRESADYYAQATRHQKERANREERERTALTRHAN